MNKKIRFSAGIALLGIGNLAHAALTSSVGPVSFDGSASVTSTANSQSSNSATNNNAAAANVSVGQFNAATGVLTGVELQLSSNRTQTLEGNGTKAQGAARTASGSGTSTAALTAPGISNTFTPAITQTGTGCSLSAGLGNSCTWGPISSGPTATNASSSAASASLNDYVGGSTVNASLSLPSLQATSTLSFTNGPASSSTTTYSVDWTGTVAATYTYLLHAAPSFDTSGSQGTLTLDFGTVTQGSSLSPLAFSVFNLADPNRVGLDLDSVSGSGDTSTITTDLTPFSNLAQGSGNLFNAFLNTATLGSFTAQYILNLSDADVGASSTRGNYQITLNLKGNVAPVPVPAALWLFGSALAGLGAIRRRHVAA